MKSSPTHLGVVLTNDVDKKSFIQAILSGGLKEDFAVFNQRKGFLFSELAIKAHIENELRYDIVGISNLTHRPLRTFSSGERRQLLFRSCVTQNPDFIILDNFFDHLDQQSRKNLSIQLVDLAKSTSIIQIENRVENLLPFISNRKYILDNSFQILDTNSSKISLGMPKNFEFPDALIDFEKHYEIIIKFDKVTISYEDQTIVKDITWEVKEGEFWQLLGPNGSGKSTLLSLITGENPMAYSQNIIIFDRKKGSGESIWDIKSKIGFFSTSLAESFNKNQSVEQMVLSGFFDSVGLYEKPNALQQQKALQWLKIIHMDHLKNSRFNKLSLGQQRLILIIRALIKQPPLLIIDEPLEGLDQSSVILVSQLINALIEKTDLTVLYVSHTLENSLSPSHIYELTPHKNGSLGRIKEAGK